MAFIVISWHPLILVVSCVFRGYSLPPVNHVDQRCHIVVKRMIRCVWRWLTLFDENTEIHKILLGFWTTKNITLIEIYILFTKSYQLEHLFKKLKHYQARKTSKLYKWFYPISPKPITSHVITPNAMTPNLLCDTTPHNTIQNSINPYATTLNSITPIGLLLRTPLP